MEKLEIVRGCFDRKIEDGRPVGKVTIYSIEDLTEVADTKLDLHELFAI